MLRPVRLALIALALAAAAARAQDANYMFPVERLELLLRDSTFRVTDIRGARAEGDRTQRVVLEFSDSVRFAAQLAKAPQGGGTFNNQPRYELAAYALQKLFLEPDEYVVPPTVVRAFPLAWLRQFDPTASATFDGTASVVVALKYWLLQVTPEQFFDRDRARRDTVYERYLGNFNIVTYLIRHVDANEGNYLISQDTNRPRVFSVDNGVAFESEVSNQGDEWRRLRVERLPRATIDRLRGLTPERLHEVLAVLVQFDIHDGLLVNVEPGSNLSDGRGVRRADNTVQFGLSAREIRGIADRLRSLLRDVDRGRIKMF